MDILTIIILIAAIEFSMFFSVAFSIYLTEKK